MKLMFSRKALAIRRDEYTFSAYAYTNTFNSIFG